jgi:hypothetical protein
MPFCIQCGARLEEGAKFCTSCGARQPAPAASSFAPPAEERPAQPQQSARSYDPTVYGGRERAAGQPAGGQKNRKKGAIVFIALAVLVVIAALAFILSSLKGAGPGTDDSAVLGVYSLQKAEMSGISVDIGGIWENGFTIELKAGGKARIEVDGKGGSARWTLKDREFTLKGSGIDCGGTLKNGTLVLRDVMGSGVKLTFTKDGAALPAA